MCGAMVRILWLYGSNTDIIGSVCMCDKVWWSSILTNQSDFFFDFFQTWLHFHVLCSIVIRLVGFQ